MKEIEKAKNKFIFELRYKWLSKSFDKRGELIDKLFPHIKNKIPNWNVHNSGVNFIDDPERPIYQIGLDHHRVVLIYEIIDENVFLEDINYVLKSMYELYGNLPELSRLGVRFISLYPHKSASVYSDVSDKINKVFSFSSPFSFKIKDFSYIFNHENGRVIIGPFQKNETYVKAHFSESEANTPNFGIAVDVDSFIEDFTSNNVGDLIEYTKKVFNASRMVQIEIINKIFGANNG